MQNVADNGRQSFCKKFINVIKFQNKLFIIF